jgi:hypothetical protein
MDAHMPYPAVVIDRRSDLVAANDAFDRLMEGAAPELLEPPVNVARLVLHPQGLARRILNLDDWAWHVLDALANQARRNPDPWLDDLVAELSALVPERPRSPGPNHLGFSVPLRLRSDHGELRLLTTLTYFGTAVDVTVAELRMEAFLPADAETAALFATMPPWRTTRRSPSGSGR